MQLIVSFSIKICTELCIGNVVLCRETLSSSQGLLQFSLEKKLLNVSAVSAYLMVLLKFSD